MNEISGTTLRVRMGVLSGKPFGGVVIGLGTSVFDHIDSAC